MFQPIPKTALLLIILIVNFFTYSKAQNYQLSDNRNSELKSNDSYIYDYIEDINDRTQFSRSLKHKTIEGKSILQKSYAPMHQWVNNAWVRIIDTLINIDNIRYENDYRIAISGIDKSLQYTYFRNEDNIITFNDWHLSGININGNDTVLETANWSQILVTNNRVYVTDVFKGIDAEIHILRGRMKTNFIVKALHYKEYTHLIFNDNIKYNDNKVDYILTAKNGLGSVNVLSNNQSLLHINKAVAYVENKLDNTFKELPYRIYETSLGIEVSTMWLKDNISKGNVIIDPMIYSSDYISQSSITGSKYSEKCFDAYCAYNMSVEIPEKVIVNDVRFDFDYIANAPCKVNQGGYSIHMGSCKSPYPAQVFQCTEDNPGICEANNISIIKYVNDCLEKSYCNSATLDFDLRLYRCNGKGDDCGDECIGAATDWVMTIETYKYAISSNKIKGDTLMCVNTASKFERNLIGGAIPYTHIWSSDIEGRVILDTNEVFYYTPTKVGLTKIYAISTDNCGNSFIDSISIDVKSNFYSTENYSICKSALPFKWRGEEINKSGDSVMFKRYTTTYKCDSIYFLNLKIIDTVYNDVKLTLCKSSLPYKWNGITITKAGDSIAHYITKSTITGCDSITYLHLYINDTAKAEVAITLCESAFPYTWNGIKITKGGEGIATYYSKSKTTSCDSLTVLNISVHKTLHNVIIDTICSGEKFTIGFKSYNKSGSYYDSFKTIIGCDSVVNLKLFVKPVDTIEYSRKICRKEEYTFFDKILNTPGTYYHTTNKGCDTVWQLNLSLNDTFKTSNNISICVGGRYIHAKDTILKAGVYVFKGVNASGCDTQLTLNVSVKKLDTVVTALTMCSLDSTLFGGKYIKIAGTYWHFDTTGDCHRMLRLNLSTRDTIISSASYTICPGGSISFRGNVFDKPGIYPVYTKLPSGCIRRENITVKYKAAIIINITEYMCDGGVYKFRDSSFTEFGKYIYKSIKGCDTTWNITVAKKDTYNTSNTVNLCKGDVYVWKGKSYDKEGSYVLPGVDKNGCDTVHTITITYKPYDTVTINQTICSGKSFTYKGKNFTKTGKYTWLDTTGKCDTVYHVNLIISDTIRTVNNTTLCHGKTLIWKGKEYNASGIYTLYGVNKNGCDTIHTINLTILPIDTIIINDYLCRLSEYKFRDSIYNKPGKYIYQQFNKSTCDSVFVINLKINDTIKSYYSDTLCTGKKYIWKSVEYDKSGVYVLKGNNADGCDTIHTLNLYFKPIDTISYIDTIICSGTSFKYFDNIYNKSGKYYYKSVYIDSCYIYLTLILTIADTIRTKSYDTLCYGMSYYDHGKYYSTSGRYLQYGVNATGCDTLNELNLFISPKIHDTLRTTICLGDSVAFHGVYYKNTGIYNRSTILEECDTIKVLMLSVEKPYYKADTFSMCYGKSIKYGDSIINKSGVYTFNYISAAGCDSTYVISFTVLELPIDTLKVSLCDNESYNFNGKIINTTGTYIDTIRSSSCDTMKVLIYTALPTYQESRDLVYCKNELPIKYEDITIPISAVSTINYDTLKYINKLGCDSIIILNLIINDTFVTNVDTLICSSEKYFFGTTMLDTSGYYSFKFKTINNCDSIININLKYTTPIIELFDTIVNCGTVYHRGIEYNSYTVIHDTLRNEIGCDSFRLTTVIDARRYYNDTFDIVICEGGSYLYNQSDLTKPGYYTVFDKTNQGCDSIVTLNLIIAKNPDLDISYTWLTNEHCLGDEIRLHIQGEGSYYYHYNNDSSQLISGDKITMELPYNHIFVTGISEEGCISRGALEISSMACCELRMPNAFSPNNDGLNDIFRPITNAQPIDYSFEIYNRWGERIFMTSKILEGWNGVDNTLNKLHDVGTYYYIIRGKCFDNTPIYLKGDVILIR